MLFNLPKLMVMILVAFGLLNSGCDKPYHYVDDKTDNSKKQPVADQASPTQPGKPSIQKSESENLQLTWDASTDNVSQPKEIKYFILISESKDLITNAQIDKQATGVGETKGVT